MYVKIGPYKNWIGPYQIAEKLLFWLDKYEDDRVHKFGEWLAENRKGEDSWLTKVCTWIHNRSERTIKVKLDSWDTWSMDGTLAIIILPMLKQLNKQKHGAPFVDDIDVPEGLNLRSTEAPAKENEHDTDENHFKRWDWVMNEMIWTFEQLQPDCDWEDQYYSGTSDISWKPCDDKPEFLEMVEGPNHTFSLDKGGYEKHNARIQNGLILFGKYYRGLWD